MIAELLIPPALLAAFVVRVALLARAPLSTMPYFARATYHTARSYVSVAAIFGLVSAGHLMFPDIGYSLLYLGAPLASPGFIWAAAALTSICMVGGLGYTQQARKHVSRYLPEGAQAAALTRLPSFKLIALSAFAFYFPAQAFLGVADRLLPASESLYAGEVSEPTSAQERAYGLSFEGRRVVVMLPELPLDRPLAEPPESVVVLIREGVLLYSVLGVYHADRFYPAASVAGTHAPYTDEKGARVELESRQWRTLEGIRTTIADKLSKVPLWSQE